MHQLELSLGLLALTLGSSLSSDGGALGFQLISQRPLRKRPINTSLQSSKNNFNNNHHHNSLPNSLSSSFRTALCIIPPDEDWDTLQRARHFAQDDSYNQWPPAIRLFHPFCDRSQISNIAFDVANVVEKHNIKPFSITLNQWTVMPLPNSLENMLRAEEEDEEIDEADDDSPSLIKTEEEIAIQELIANEERKGLERKRQRELKKERKRRHEAIEEGLAFEKSNSTLQSATTTTATEEEESSQTEETSESFPRDLFNGPAMIALEPDPKSIRKLKRLREILRHELQGETKAENLMWDTPMPFYLNQKEEDFEAFVDDITAFRPLIPMGAFPTTDAALDMARKLKGLWDPLTFDVTEFHFISQPISSKEQLAAETQSYYDTLHPNPYSKKIQQAAELQDKRTPFGCDAVVMLMGEEIEQDEEANALMAQMVCNEGSPGNYGMEDGDELESGEKLISAEGDNEYTRQSHMKLMDEFKRKLKAEEGDYEELLDWLEDDEDDELEIGTTVVIGRTHFFSGETRLYDGMPARVNTDEEQASFGISSLGPDALI